MNQKKQSTNPPSNRRQPEEIDDEPILRFTPTAWAKLQFFCHQGPTEIGGFGITAPDDPLLIIDFITVKQKATSISVAFDDGAVAEFFDEQVDSGKKPQQFARHWLHTHPANCSVPSLTDEYTFREVFGRCEWAVMFILAQNGGVYARLRFNVGPGGEIEIPVRIDYSQPFAGSDQQAWLAEYQRNIQVVRDSWNVGSTSNSPQKDKDKIPSPELLNNGPFEPSFGLEPFEEPYDLIDLESEVF